MTNKETFKFSTHQVIIVALLALTQFTVILDFMVISPLGDVLMKSLNITPRQFGVAVSSYAFSAAVSGMLTAGFADRFDRKKLLLFFYIGFIIGTLLCATATSYNFLIFARIVTGLFGGVIGSIGLTIVTDLFPLQMRGRAMGIIQMGLAASQVLGIPIGLYFANRYSWHAPFTMIVILGCCICALIAIFLEPVDQHLLHPDNRDVLQRFRNIIANSDYKKGFILTAFIYISGFLMQPFASAFFVNNLQVSVKQLPFIFFFSGVSSLVIMPVMGKLSDKIDKFKLFAVGGSWAIIMLLVYVHLPVVPLWTIIVVNILLFMGLISRNVPATAAVSAIPNIPDRGAFMSINASLQQLAGGLAATLAGLIVTQNNHQGPIMNYPLLGYVSIVFMLFSIWAMYRVTVIIRRKTEA